MSSRPRVELGLLGTLLAFTTAGAKVLGTALTRTVSDGPDLSPTAVFLSIGVIFTTAVAFTLALAFFSLVVATVGGLDTRFWTRAATSIQDFALWLTVRWLILWGCSFGTAMLVFNLLTPHYARWVAGSIAVVSVPSLIVALRRALPAELWRISGHFDPAHHLGLGRGLLAFVALTAVGHLDGCQARRICDFG